VRLLEDGKKLGTRVTRLPRAVRCISARAPGLTDTFHLGLSGCCYHNTCRFTRPHYDTTHPGKGLDEYHDVASLPYLRR